MNRRRVAREWLYFAGCLVLGILVAILAVAGGFKGDVMEPLLTTTFTVYVVIQLVRLTAWAYRTLRERN